MVKRFFPLLLLVLMLQAQGQVLMHPQQNDLWFINQTFEDTQYQYLATPDKGFISLGSNEASLVYQGRTGGGFVQAFKGEDILHLYSLDGVQSTIKLPGTIASSLPTTATQTIYLTLDTQHGKSLLFSESLPDFKATPIPDLWEESNVLEVVGSRILCHYKEDAAVTTPWALWELKDARWEPMPLPHLPAQGAITETYRFPNSLIIQESHEEKTGLISWSKEQDRIINFIHIPGEAKDIRFIPFSAGLVVEEKIPSGKFRSSVFLCEPDGALHQASPYQRLVRETSLTSARLVGEMLVLRWETDGVTHLAWTEHEDVTAEETYSVWQEEELAGSLVDMSQGSQGLIVITNRSELIPKTTASGQSVLNLETQQPVLTERYTAKAYRLNLGEPKVELGAASGFQALAPLQHGRNKSTIALLPSPERKGDKLKLWQLNQDNTTIIEPLYTLDRESLAFGSQLTVLENAWPLKDGRFLTGAEQTLTAPLIPEKTQEVQGYSSRSATLLLATANDNTQGVLVDNSGTKLLAQEALRPWVFPHRLVLLAITILIVVLILASIEYARRKDIFIRKLPGLDAIEEAVGRATEMGRPVLYVTGLGDVDDIQTLASLSILSNVAQTAAAYETPILVPTSRAVVMSIAQEVVQESYLTAGRPENFQPDQVSYLTDDQFGYAAGVDGIILREKPAANFYMGPFFAESLIMAETGFTQGSMQIAGTAEPAQLPFFVVTCDYTLIGEELYAASAYLSKDPLQIGSLRGQDLVKLLIMLSLVGGTLWKTFGG